MVEKHYDFRDSLACAIKIDLQRLFYVQFLYKERQRPIVVTVSGVTDQASSASTLVGTTMTTPTPSLMSLKK